MASSNWISRGGAIAGMTAAALNLAAVAALWHMPHVYKPENIGLWLDEVTQAPGATCVAAVAFTIGLSALVPFCVALAERDRGTAVGASLLAAGALLDAAGTMAPVGALHVARPVGEGLLWLTLLLDSSFNALLGLGLLLIAAAMRPEAGWPRGLRALAFVAGTASLPVAGQFVADAYARLLTVSGPLWIGWVVWASVALWRRPDSGSRA